MNGLNIFCLTSKNSKQSILKFHKILLIIAFYSYHKNLDLHVILERIKLVISSGIVNIISPSV